MKKITLLLAFAFIALTLNAQIASEDFEGGLPDGWSTVVNTGDCDWFSGTVAGGIEGFDTNGMFFDDDACGNGAPASNVELVSDVYDLSANSDAITVTYDFNYDDLTTPGDDSVVAEYWDGTAWVNIATYDDDFDPGITETFDLGVLTNADMQVRFVYDDGDDWAWSVGVDNFILDAVLSTDDNEISDFKMFPNPAQEVLNVNAGTSIERVQVYNLAGQVVMDQEIGATTSQLNVSRLQTGAYLMQVTADGQTGTYKFVKQ